MDDKRNSLLTIGLVCAVLLVLGVADLWNSDRVYSEAENRVLASRPAFSWESLFTGEYGDAYEKYMSDQFVGRDKWVGLKTRADIRFRKKEINGVYLGADHYLIGVNDPGEYTEQMENSRVASLTKLVNHWDAKVMLVPTADNILTDKLPAFAPYYDEERLLTKVRNSIGEEHYIDVYHALQEHAQEPIYYRTDHHWTSLGAYYGFLAWADSVGRFPYPYDVNGMKTVSENFQGTLQSRINVDWTKDSIQYFPETEKKAVSVTYDFADTADSLYAPDYLDTKNQYGFFLNDNHAFIEIHTGYNPGKTLFVIKDSYANSLIPLLTAHYENIYVVDLRYFNGKLFQLMEQYEPEQGMDVLVLYDCIHFLEILSIIKEAYYGLFGHSPEYHCGTAEVPFQFSKKIRTELSYRHDGSGPDYFFCGDHEGGLRAGDRAGHRYHDPVSCGARGQRGGRGDRQGTDPYSGRDITGL